MPHEVKAQDSLMVGNPGKAAKITEIRLYSVAATPASLNAAAGETLTFTATGAALGDFVLLMPIVDSAGLTTSAYVSSTNNVQVRLQNETAGAVHLADGTWEFLVIKAEAVS
jgi:hypothetical protein